MLVASAGNVLVWIVWLGAAFACLASGVEGVVVRAGIENLAPANRAQHAEQIAAPIGPDDLTIQHLEKRVSAGDVREVIIATNPSIEGEATALYVQRKLSPYHLTVSRIARGLPVGGDLEYADGVTIAQALSARRAM